MPLIKSASKETFSDNVSEMMHAGHPQKQALAAAYRVMREAKSKRAHGGKIAAEKALPPNHQLGMRVPEGGSMCANCRFLAGPRECGNEGFVKWNGSARLPDPADQYCCDLYERRERASGGRVHVGPIRGKDPGRTDTIEMKVADGSYVLPSETISHLGENNTESGLRKAQEYFGPNGHFSSKGRAKGGSASNGKPVDCITAAGEFVVGPETVARIGGGDLDRGHKILDHFVLNMRKDHLRTLASLEPPAQD